MKHKKTNGVRVSKVRVLKASQPEPDTHRVLIEAEVKGAPGLPSADLPAILDFNNKEPLTEHAGGWFAWLRKWMF